MRIHSLRLALAATAFATLGLAGRGQAQTTPTQDGSAMRGGQRGGANMFKELNLSADQQTKIEALMKDERAKGGMRGGQSGPPSDAERQAMQTRRAEMEAKMKEILTPEQYTKYQNMRPQRGQGRQRPSSDAPAN
jgi:protein CpxP